MTTQTPAQTPAWLNHVPRRRTKLSQLWQVPTFLAGVAALVVLISGSMFRQHQDIHAIQRELGELRSLLQARPAELGIVVSRAETLVDRAREYPEVAGEAHLLFGEALAGQAVRSGSGKANDLNLAARAQFEQAEAVGVSDQYAARLAFQLGRILHLTGGEPRQVIAQLTRGLPGGTDEPATGYGFLVKAYLHLPDADLDAALAANDQQLKLTSDEAVLMPARLLRGELLVRQRSYAEALRVLEWISPLAPEPILKRSRYLRAVCALEEEQWVDAAPLWAELLRTPEEVPGGRRAVLFTLGKCYINMLPAREAEAITAWDQAKQEGGEEGQAAALLLAELRLFGPGQNLSLALEDLQVALREVKSPSDYRNRLVPLGDVGLLIKQALGQATEVGAFDSAEQLAALYRRVGDPATADRELGKLDLVWARQLEQQATQTHPSAAEHLQQQARTRWKQAAQLYQKVAKTQPTEHHPELLWKAIDGYRRAGEARTAVSLLQGYVELPLTDAKRAEAWYALAESRETIGQHDEARAAYYKCAEFSATAFAYRARHALALDKIQQEKLDDAEGILKQNLEITDLSVDREAHEKSLYKLATLLYQRGNYAQAYLYLKEATQQYPANPQVLFVRDLLGDCYRRLGQQMTEQMTRTDELSAAAVSYARRKRLEWLDLAQVTYLRLLDELKARQAANELNGKEEKLLPKVSFVIADIQFDMNNFAESLRRYTELAQSYSRQVEELIACQRIWRCVSVLVEADQRTVALAALQNALRSAQANMAAIPEDQFGGPGNWSRQEWERWVGEVQRQLQRTGATGVGTETRVLRPPPQ